MKDMFTEIIKFCGCLMISCLFCGFLIGLAVKINDWFGTEDDSDSEEISIIVTLALALVTILTAICMEVIK